MQSASPVHPRYVSTLQCWSTGPASQTPSWGPSAGFGEQVPSSQPLGRVGWPGLLQKLDGHCEAVVQGAPMLAPPRQRRPPHTTPPGQSELVLQASPAASAHVSQKQFAPGASEQGRTVASWVVPVVAGLKPRWSVPMLRDDAGWQSMLSGPKKSLVPLTSQGSPFRTPSLHVPPFTPSRGVGSPTQMGQGCCTASPLCTVESRLSRTLPSPACGPLSETLAVPVRGPESRLMTQTGTAPAEIGSGGPSRQEHVSPPPQLGDCGSHGVSELESGVARFEQTQFFAGPGNEIGPLRSH